MDKKDKILEKLSRMTVEQLDRLRDEKDLEYKDALHKLSKAEDDQLVLARKKRLELQAQGNTLSKTEQLMRGDEELYNMKRLILALRDIKNQLKITAKMVDRFYWKARM